MKRDTEARRRIQGAMPPLMREKEFSKITVSDIIRKAGVGRSTYYYHYYLPQEIVDEMVGDLIDELREGFDRAVSREDPDYQSFVLEGVTSFFGHRELLGAIFSSPEQEALFSERFHAYWRETGSEWNQRFYGTGAVDPIYDSYVFHGVYNAYKSWILGGCVESVEHVSDVIADMCLRITA